MPYSVANGVKIYYEVSGEGLPFVLVHANPFGHNLWMYQIAHFSTYFKVIAVITGAVHKILLKTGHACCIEDPAGFDATVIDFLKAKGLMPAALSRKDS